MPLASKIACRAALQSFGAPVLVAWHEGLLVIVIGQFKHGAFALTQLFGHRKQFRLV